MRVCARVCACVDGREGGQRDEGFIETCPLRGLPDSAAKPPSSLLFITKAGTAVIALPSTVCESVCACVCVCAAQ